MKSLIPGILALFLFACGGAENAENVIDQVEGGSASLPKVAKGDITEVFDAFMNCKETSEERHACKEFPAKGICVAFGIGDFKKADGSFYPYDEILNHLPEGLWERVGPASSQEALNKAQAAANQGIAAFAVSTASGKGNVAIIMPGAMKHSNKWNLDCPAATSFFMQGHQYSILNKTLNYAWKAPEGVDIYVRKQ